MRVQLGRALYEFVSWGGNYAVLEKKDHKTNQRRDEKRGSQRVIKNSKGGKTIAVASHQDDVPVELIRRERIISPKVSRKEKT